MNKLSFGFLQINNKNKTAAVIQLLPLFLPLVFIAPEIDNDFWFQIKSGETITKLWPNGFLTEEPFTIHKGWAFSFEKWLTDVSFYEIYTHFGNIGIYMMLIVFSVLLSLAVYKTCILVSGNRINSAVITAVALCFFNARYMRTRPQIFAYVLLTTEIYVLEKYTQKNNIKILIWLPVLSLVYMQFHSTMWPVFFIFMLPYLFEFKLFAVKGSFAKDYRKLPLAAAFALSLAAGIINPNGLRSITYLINSGVNEISDYIVDLQPANYKDLIYFGVILILHCIFYFNKDRKDIPLRYLFFNLGTFLMLLFAVRNSAYYILAGTVTASYMFRDFKVSDIQIPKFFGISFILVAIMYCTVLLGNFAMLEDRIYDSTAGKDAADFLCEYIENTGENKEDLKLFTCFNTGSYPEWMGFKCYIDPRGEVFIESINKKEDVFDEYIRFYYGIIKYSVLQEKYNFDYWLAEKELTCINYMLDDPDYKKLYEDEGYCVLKYTGGK